MTRTIQAEPVNQRIDKEVSSAPCDFPLSCTAANRQIGKTYRNAMSLSQPLRHNCRRKMDISGLANTDTVRTYTASADVDEADLRVLSLRPNVPSLEGYFN